MKGRLWLVIGVLLGIAVAAGRVPYLAGAGKALMDTAEHLVLSGANRLIASAAKHGAPKRAIQGVSGVLAVLVPGITALLLIVAAKATLRIRAIIAILILLVGATSYVYHPGGVATGALMLALFFAGLAVTLTGPLVAAPLAMGAGLIAAEFLPTLFSKHSSATHSAVEALHLAIYNTPGDPLGLQIVLLVVAVAPMVWAAKLVVS